MVFGRALQRLASSSSADYHDAGARLGSATNDLARLAGLLVDLHRAVATPVVGAGVDPVTPKRERQRAPRRLPDGKRGPSANEQRGRAAR